jgi:hypothetical protein
VSTTYPEIIRFRIKSIFTNNMEHISPIITYTVYCSNDYPITEATPAINPQIVIDGLTEGFKLPGYTHP